MAESTPMPEDGTCPVEGCRFPVDVLLVSSDGVVFGAHQRNLEMYSEGFPVAGSTIACDPVFLEEKAEVLHLLLSYTHHIRVPNLENISFNLLYSLAEAVEKYTLYSAMEFCKIEMTQSLDDHPNEVFFYAAKHHYPDLLNRAAKLTLKNRTWDFIDLIRQTSLHDDFAFRWLRYRDRWMEVLARLPTVLPRRHRGVDNVDYCVVWHPFQVNVYRDVSRNLGVLDIFSDVLEKHLSHLGACKICLEKSVQWAFVVQDEISALPKYSEL